MPLLRPNLLWCARTASLTRGRALYLTDRHETMTARVARCRNLFLSSFSDGPDSSLIAALAVPSLWAS
ncbi:unnamed protein product [Ectocarpus sp. CCAP 1310/34]|nr:unnamed protein product [Ectocarpus sp. CCAP 1310/34]